MGGKLREDLGKSISEAVAGVGSEWDASDESAITDSFEQQLAAGAIIDRRDRGVACRVLMEVASVDGSIDGPERALIEQLLGEKAEHLDAVAAEPPPSETELQLIANPAVRETVLMLAWAVALIDARIDPRERIRLDELAEALEIPFERADSLMQYAGIFLKERAFDMVWPADESIDLSPSEAGNDLDSKRITMAFDAMADEYASLIAQWVPRYDELLRASLAHIPAGLEPSNILELGCGDGNLSERLARRYPEANLVLVDLSEQMLARCRRRVPAATYHQRDFRNLTFEAGGFDLVISSLSIHHLDNPAKQDLFRKVKEWLRPGGAFSYADVFAGATPEIQAEHLREWRRSSFAVGIDAADWARLQQHEALLTHPAPLMDQLRWLLETGFSVVDCSWKHAMWTHIIALK